MGSPTILQAGIFAFVLLLQTEILCSAQTPPPTLFSEPVNSFAPTNLTDIAAGDFNNDGKIDCVGIYNPGTINTLGLAVFTNDGQGAFTFVTNYFPSGPPGCILTGDFNQDLKLDVLTVNYAGSPKGYSVFTGHGDGTFSFTNTAFDHGYFVPGATTGDFNNDGKLDFAVAIGHVRLFLGNGNNTFANSTIHTLDTGTTYGITDGDFDGDGDSDLALGRGSSPGSARSISVLMGLGNGTFSAPTNFGSATASTDQHTALVSADFNNDDKVDLAVCNNVDKSITIRLGNGSGAFSQEVRYSTPRSPVAVQGADFNGDGNMDIISYPMALMEGHGDGTFGAAMTNFPGFLAATANRQAIAVADFNGDGKPDVATGRASFQNLTVWLNETPPELKIEIDIDDLVLSWPDWDGYQLEYTTTLPDVSDWTVVTNVPAVLGNQNVVTTELTEGNRFFRLRQLD